MPGTLHFKEGYAIVTWHYTLSWTETEPINPGRDAYADQVNSNNARTKTFTDVFSSTNWAKCKRNQTGDEFVSRWMSDVVHPCAMEQVQAYMRDIDQQSADRRSRWEQRGGGRLVEQGQQPPPRRVCHAYDASKLRMDKAHAQKDKPGEGLEIAWTS